MRRVGPPRALPLRERRPGAPPRRAGLGVDDVAAAGPRDADGVVVGLERIDEALIARVPHLRIIAKYGVGLDNIALAACAARRIAVGWTPGVNAAAVAELTLTLMLGLATGAFARAAELRDGAWNKRGGVLLSGRTVGVVGLGYVGREVVHLLRPFGCRVLGNDVVDRSAWCTAEGVETVDQDTIWSTADVVTLHVPLTADTHHLIDDRVLARFRPEAVLVNTSRGKVVDQAALQRALVAGRIAGAALDVFESEPPTTRRCSGSTLIATPHIGGGSREAVLAMGRAAIAHLTRFFASRNEERISA